MITKKTLEQTYPLASDLSTRGITLSALQGTPLADVLATCSTYGLHVEGQGYDQLCLDQVSDYLVTECGRALTQDFMPHNAATAKNADEAAKAVSGILSFARNVVVADVKEMFEKVELAVAGIRSARSEPYVIEAANTPAIFGNALLHELVERYSETIAKPIEPMQVGTIDPVQLRSLLTTGATSFDSEVVELLNGSGAVAYEQIVAVFEGRATLEEISPNAVLGVHLACKALFDNPFDGCKLSLMDFNLRIARMTEQSGRIVFHEIESVSRRQKLDMLYNGTSYNADSGKTIISVNNDVYLNLLSQGVTPEAVIANEFLGRRYNPGQLVENLELLQGVYVREINLRLMQASMEETNAAREAIGRLYAIEIATRDEDHLPADRGTLQKRLMERVALISEECLQNLPVLLRDLTCHVFYAHTDAHLILSSMDAMGARHVDMAPREIVLLVTVEYTARWVAKQMIVA
jgi:hypothetical protein